MDWIEAIAARACDVAKEDIYGVTCYYPRMSRAERDRLVALARGVEKMADDYAKNCSKGEPTTKADSVMLELIAEFVTDLRRLLDGTTPQSYNAWPPVRGEYEP